jgi:protein phosphatase 1 regulatory subunit 37
VPGVRIILLMCVVAAVKFNEVLRELFLADNKLTPSDGVQLGSLLKTNRTLSLLDLRNNLLQVMCW